MAEPLEPGRGEVEAAAARAELARLRGQLGAAQKDAQAIQRQTAKARVGARAIGEEIQRASSVAERRSERIQRRERAADRTAGGARRPPPPPPPPPAGPTPPPPPPDGPRRRAAREARVAARAATPTARAAVAPDPRPIDQFANSQRRLGGIMRSLEPTYRQHGALTTEAIQAATRGELSYREWGYQIGATAAKFAGWVGVSIPVFAALDAIRSVGTGAIESAGGVDQLRRVIDNVDSDQAQQAFRDLSEEFNLPIADVVKAVELAGRRFQTLPQAVEAARAGLYAQRTGDVPIEEGMARLSAVATAMQVPASSLLGIFDQINEAQNKFNVSIEDTTAGLAKAAGTFKNASQNADPERVLTFLNALIGVGKLTTGRTGENFATAIQRSVGFQQRPGNRKALEAFGIETDRGAIGVFEQALQLAQTMKKQGRGDDLFQLAQAISSPLYASFFVPMLQNAEFFYQYLGTVGPRNAAGSAQRELQPILDTPREELKRLGVEFERLGSSMSQANFGAPFAAVVKGAQLAIGATSALVDEFGKLGGAASGLLLGGAFALGGGKLAAGLKLPGFRGGALPGLFGDRDPSIRKQVQRAAREDVEIAREDARAHARRVGGLDKRIEAQRAVALAAPGNVRAQEKLARAIDDRQDAMVEATAVDARLRDATKDYEDTMRRTSRRGRRLLGLGGGEDPRAIAAEKGYYIEGGPDRPGRTRGILGGFRRADGEAKQAGTLARRTQQRLRQAGSSLAMSTGYFVGEMRRGNVTAPVIAAGRNMRSAGTKAAAGVKVAWARAGSAMTAAARSIYSFLGPLGILLVGGLIVGKLADLVNEAKARAAEMEDIRNSVERTPEERKRQREALARQPEDPLGNRLLRRTLGFSKVIGRGIQQSPFGPIRRFGAGLAERAEAEQRELDPDVQADRNFRELVRRHRKDRINATRRARGIPQIERTAPSLAKDIGALEQAVKDGTISATDKAKRIALLHKEIDQSVASEAQKAQGHLQLSIIEATSARPEDFYSKLFPKEGLGAVDKQLVDSLSKEYGTLAANARGTIQDTERRMAAGILAAAQKFREGGPAGRGRALEIMEEATQQVVGGVQAQLQQDLALSTTRTGRQQAYEDAAERLQGANQRVREGFESAGRRVRRLREALRKAEAEEIPRGTDPRGLAGRYRERREKIEGLRGSLDMAKKDREALRKALKISDEETREAMLEMERQDFADEVQARELRGNVADYGRPAGIPRLRAQLQRINRNVSSAIRRFGRNSDEALGEIANARAKQEEIVRATDEIAGLRGEREVARLRAQGSTDAARNREIANARDALRRVRANRRVYSEQDVLQAEVAYWNAKAQSTEDIEQRENEIRDAWDEYRRATYALRRSLTEDPIRDAELEYAEAAADLASLRARPLPSGATQADRIRRQAEIRNAMAERNEARLRARDARFQARMDDISFYADIGKYTTDQEIAALKRLQQTMKLNRDQKREIKRRIHQLSNEDQREYQLEVGNIRLPSLYEMRRTIGAGSQNFTQTNQNVVHVNVNDQSAVPAVADALDRYVAGGNSMRRAMARR